LSVRGSIIGIEVIVVVHDRAAPLIIAIIDRLIIGLMIKDSSFNDIIVVELEEDHIVAIENRIE
jgi:hypothetical protein